MVPVYRLKLNVLIRMPFREAYIFEYFICDILFKSFNCQILLDFSFKKPVDNVSHKIFFIWLKQYHCVMT